MLHTNTIFPKTLDLLESIMQINALQQFSLAGGTSLALQIGHRISVDLDFFGNAPINKESLFDLFTPFGKLKLITQSTNILIFEIDNIKIDFISYRYPLMKPLININNIRLFSIEDIGAMKLAAIAGRGKKRDFIDLFFLLKYFSLKELISFYNSKFIDGSEFLVLKSLTYFDDAEQDEDLQMINPVNWLMVQLTIIEEVKKMYK